MPGPAIRHSRAADARRRLSMRRCRSHAAANICSRYSKSRVKPARWRANGTPSASAPWRGQRSRRRRQLISSRQTPRSRCRQSESTRRVSLRAAVENPHRGHRSRRRPSATATTIRSASNRTSRTHTWGKHTSREKCAGDAHVVPPVRPLDFDTRQPEGEDGGASLTSTQAAKTSCGPERPAQAAVQPVGSATSMPGAPKFSRMVIAHIKRSAVRPQVPERLAHRSSLQRG